MTPRGSMVLTGKKALDASGGVSAEDERGIGGYERVMGPSGQAQMLARDLRHAFQILADHHDLATIVPGERAVRPRPTSDLATRDVTLDPYTGDDAPARGLASPTPLIARRAAVASTVTPAS